MCMWLVCVFWKVIDLSGDSAYQCVCSWARVKKSSNNHFLLVYADKTLERRGEVVVVVFSVVALRTTKKNECSWVTFEVQRDVHSPVFSSLSICVQMRGGDFISLVSHSFPPFHTWTANAMRIFGPQPNRIRKRKAHADERAPKIPV